MFIMFNPSRRTLKPAPHESPSRQTLKLYPHETSPSTTLNTLVISIVSYRLYFIIYGRAKEISYFIEILLTDFFSFLCSFIKCYTIPYSSHSPNLAFLNQDTNGHILVDCQSPVHPTFVES